MSWRAVGCGVIAAAVFVGIGVLGIWRSFAPAECPDALPYQPSGYVATGPGTDVPRLPGTEAELRAIGSASFGLASWEVWVDPEQAPEADEPLPERIVLSCGNGSFQAYDRGTP